DGAHTGDKLQLQSHVGLVYFRKGFLMGVTFAEVAGSPVENYSSEGFTARRTFIVPWDERDQFAGEVLGLVGRNQTTGPAIYPGKSTIVATQIRFEPINGDRPEVVRFHEIAKDLNRYPRSFAKATIQYSPQSTEELTGGLTSESGTQITYEISYDSEEIEIPTTNWTWSESTTASPSSEPFIHRVIPIAEHRVIWSCVVNPPWTTIQNLQGTVNETEFLGAPAESLLFMGVQSNKLYRGDLSEGESAFTWKIRYIFRQRGLRHRDELMGWNHLWSPSTGTWERASCQGNSLYDTADFQELFQSEGV
ncbi:MAG: hypothetical protein Q4C47_06280, partial [Planctomycetia bacterium]|nr:hypothetical protein [Planctomycetia bacterium]